MLESDILLTNTVMMCLRRFVLAMIYGLSLLMQSMLMLASTSATANTATAFSSTNATHQHSHGMQQHRVAKHKITDSPSCCAHADQHNKHHDAANASSKAASKTVHDCCAAHGTEHVAKHSDTANQMQCQDHSCCAHSCCSGSSCPTTSSTTSFAVKPVNKFHPVNPAVPNQPIQNLKRPPKTTP